MNYSSHPFVCFLAYWNGFAVMEISEFGFQIAVVDGGLCIRLFA